jgi:hypothetical protein
MAAAKDGGPVIPATPLVSVEVKVPYQVVFDGVAHGPNEVVEVPEETAAHWVACGWVVAE